MMAGLIFPFDMFDFGTHMKHKIMKKYAGVGQFQLRLSMKKMYSGHSIPRLHESGKKMG
jgi:hypothetical protein